MILISQQPVNDRERIMDIFVKIWVQLYEKITQIGTLWTEEIKKTRTRIIKQNQDHITSYLYVVVISSFHAI